MTGERKIIPPLLQVEDLRKYYQIHNGILSKTVGFVKAVDKISFSIYPGETLGLVGESGCGKSTTGRTIVQLENQTDGNIIYKGEDISKISKLKLRKLRQELQIIFQDPYSSLNGRQRVFNILAEPLIVHKIVEKSQISKRVRELIEIVGLSEQHLHRYPHEFSGGQRQRIGIARALAVNPKLIICDEPVSALDVSVQAQILNLLKDLQIELQLTFLFIAHGLGAVKYISDRIAVMYLGKIVEIARTDDIFNRPKHPYTNALMNAYPEPNPHLRDREKIVLQGDVPNPANPPKGCRFHTRCPLARDICRKVEPGLTGNDHGVACHFPIDEK